MNNIGFCGDNCLSCPRYLATLSNDNNKLKEVAVMWKRVGWRDKVISIDEIKCRGCKTVKWCRYNDIRECAINKKLSNCGECIDYPCKILISVFDKTESYANDCKLNFNEEDYILLNKAFFTKRKNLDLIHKLKFQKNITIE